MHDETFIKDHMVVVNNNDSINANFDTMCEILVDSVREQYRNAL